MLDFVEVELLAGGALEYVEHVQAGGLEVRGRIVASGDKYLAVETVVDRHHIVRDADELLFYRAEQIQTGLDLDLGILRLHRGRDHSYEPAFRRNLMSVRHKRHIDIGITTDLRKKKKNEIIYYFTIS